MMGEWVRYLEVLRSTESTEEAAIEWWEERKHVFPVLYPLAMALLITPITSAAAERVFSLVTNIIRPQRNRLQEETILAELFQRYNDF